MKKLYILFILSSFTVVRMSFGQQMPIDFSAASDNFNGFSGSSFSFTTDPDDSGNDVGQFFNDGNVTWQGFYIDLNVPINLDDGKEITLNFYQFDPNNHTIYIKLENGTNPDVEVVQNNSTVGWTNDITFDFSNATYSGTSNTVDATGTYSRLTIFIDGGAMSSGTYLIDNINDGSEPTDPNALDVEYTDLVWADEFSTDGTVNSTNWFHQTQLPSGGSWFNGEEQHYTDRTDNSFVTGGFLNIVAIKENFTDQGETKQYTSARLNSKFAFTYGRVDVRAQLPFGEGTWPAIWTLGKNINEDGAYWDNQGFGTTSWPACGEIDIMEHGLHSTNEVSVALHTPSSFGNTMNTSTEVISDVANNFHIYSMNWSPDEIAFLVDGNVIYRYNPTVKDANTWPFDEPQYLLLNIAMGGISGTIDPSFTESSMIVDYVRVYQNNSLSTEDRDLNKTKIYPNPSSNQVNIQSNVNFDSIRLYTVLGELVLDTKGEKQIDVSGVSAGIYILKLNSLEKSISRKIIID
ncbi:family 16 glycosylhydrolase [Winogradskyella sp. A3E31]|uniref:family 16 glycosylhydrolase n=1 Tax=Winogradskyella sp. A3E31 TaxID=3349637 RepID=UPI00398BAB3A